mgnify:CR=1 FL=1
MIYSSIDNDKIKELKKLHLKKYRDKKHEFLIETPHLVLEAFKTGHLKELILEENEVFPLDVKTINVTNNVINYLSELKSSNNVMGLCSYKKDNQILGNRLLILENIQDPGNLGTIIRSSVAFNIDTIILSNGCVDIYNSKVLRSSQGMIFHQNILRKDLLLTIPKLKEEGYKIIGTKVTHGKSLKYFQNLKKFAIIMGNEGNGLTEELQELSDDFLYIDMNDKCESLNVAIATSIILYELNK